MPLGSTTIAAPVTPAVPCPMGNALTVAFGVSLPVPLSKSQVVTEVASSLITHAHFSLG